MNRTRKSENLYDGITDIRDDLITDSAHLHVRFTYIKRLAAIAAILAVSAIAGFALFPIESITPANARTLAKAEYPQMAKYPNEADYFDDSDGGQAAGGSNDNGSIPESDSIFDDSGAIPDSPDASDGAGETEGALDANAYTKAYDAWWEDVSARRKLSESSSVRKLSGFSSASAKCFLSGANEKKENRVYSPLGAYMALGMLAELTDGNSRRQILDLLGSDSVASLRKQASDIWNAHYRDDGLVTSILASSLWLNDDVEFHQPVLNTLAKYYYASSYQGKMGSKSFNKALQDWLNEQTGGLLEKQAADATLKPDTAMALAVTLNYHAQWRNEFSSKYTKEGTFHAASGDSVCDFLHKYKSSHSYYWGEKFSAVCEGLEQSGSMWFLLPDEGVTAEDLLNDNEAMAFLQPDNQENWENQKSLLVNLAIPKFDVTCEYDLKEGLMELGVTDIYSANRADFSPMASKPDKLALSQADHAARIAIDEQGVTAASYTVIGADTGSAMPPDKEIDFTLDRPFLFAVTDRDGQPLFLGIVNQP